MQMILIVRIIVTKAAINPKKAIKRLGGLQWVFCGAGTSPLTYTNSLLSIKLEPD
jgi:hypothetical protein